MKILDRYMARELLAPFLFGLTLFVLLLVSGEYLFKLATFVARGAPFLPVAELFVLRLVIMSVVSIPMATLLGVLLAFGRLSSDSELVAMQAGGIPVTRIARASIAFGVLFSFVSLGVNEFVVPPAGRASRRIEDMILTQIRNQVVAGIGDGKAFVVQDFDGKKLARVVIARQFDPQAGTMENVIYLQLDSAGRITAVVESEQAEWIERNQWRFRNARITGVGPSSQERHVGIDGVPSATVMPLNKTPGQISRDLKKPEEMSYRELADYIDSVKKQRAGGRALRALEVALCNKISMPFACLVFAILGTPLGIRRHRSGAAVGVGISLFVTFGYYVLWHTMAIMGENGQIAPLAASWIANVIGCGLGIALLVRAAR